MCRLTIKNGQVTHEYVGDKAVWGAPRSSDISHLGPMQAAAAMLDSMITIPGPRCIGIKNAGLVWLNHVHTPTSGWSTLVTCANNATSEGALVVGSTTGVKRKRGGKPVNETKNPRQGTTTKIQGQTHYTVTALTKLVPLNYHARGEVMSADGTTAKGFMDLPVWFQDWMLQFMPSIGTHQRLPAVYYYDKKYVNRNMGISIADKGTWYMQVKLTETSTIVCSTPYYYT